MRPDHVKNGKALEARRARMEARAEAILEKVLKRQRWTVPDRDRIADYLERVVNEEMKERMK